jgi:1-deoxy-D-xylulose-5-phosphate reductoisomerase
MGTSRHIHLAIIGSTGSIGRSALDVVREHRDEFDVIALAACSNSTALEQQITEFNPRYAALHDAGAARALEKAHPGVDVRGGSDGVSSLASLEDVDIVLLAVVGMAGLVPALEAVKAGKRLALATKEVLVSAGPVILEEVKKNRAEIIPVDSEHSAIFQCLQAAGERGIRSVNRLVLTASGGPFHLADRQQLRTVTPAEALAHPTWSMGDKITIDSATLMNKGLEVIEARWMFDIAAEQIEVVIHPQSIIHSLVEFCDGAMVAQLSQPDMRLAILYALTYPERRPLDLPRLDLPRIKELTFFEPDVETFPCLRLAYEALHTGGTAPAILNAANEVAVEKFLAGRIGFLDIPAYIEQALNTYEITAHPNLDDIIAADARVREAALT